MAVLTETSTIDNYGDRYHGAKYGYKNYHSNYEKL